ncbi:HAD family hydrolase [Streptosporangium sp. NPDC000239]|uniref:HAD family hydrolase n=1 Tax=Streptosporangium jomthongense TaxID=1193683 RepID=A0ABV8EQK7_9ACTN
MPFTAVIFDFFGTLTPSTPAHVWDDHAARSAAPLGIPVPVWRAALDSSFEERATGSLGDLRSTILTLARRCGVDPGETALTAACSARAEAQRELFTLRDDALGTLGAIRERGLAVGVLSDCTAELVRAWPELPLASLVDAAVLSCEIGRRKPDPELFLLAARRLGVTPGECLYVGDGGGRELTGATACGMTAFMLYADDWESADAQPREHDWAGPRLSRLSAVLDVLGAA